MVSLCSSQCTTRSSLLFPYTTLFRSVVCFLEGPAVDGQGNVFFSDISGNRILKRAPDGDIAEEDVRSEEHTSELQSQSNLVCRLLLEKKKMITECPSQFAKRRTLFHV